MLLFWLAAKIIVHESSNIELELSKNFVDRTLVRPLLDLSLQQIVHLDDLLIGVSQIILASVEIWHRH